LRAVGVRVHVDDRDERPGFKFNDWEMRGVPVRLEVGPKDVENGKAVLARRDVLGRDGKQFIAQEALVPTVQQLLIDIQANLLQQATDFREANTHDVTSYDEVKEVIAKGGWARGGWAGSDDDERRVKDEIGATLRCLPLEQPAEVGRCFLTGEAAERVAIFAKAY